MKISAMLCTVLLALFASGAMAQQVVRSLPVTLQLDVDAQGQVTAATVMPPSTLSQGKAEGVVYTHVVQKRKRAALPDVLVKAAERMASQWRFKAPMVHGKSVPGRTWARATLQIVKRAPKAQTPKTYGVRLKYVGNGPYFYQRVTPAYPPRAFRSRASAAMIVDALVQPDDTLSDIHVEKVYTNVRVAKAMFRRAAVKAFRRWKGKAERVNGRTVATHVRIAFFLSLNGGGQRFLKMAERDMQRQNGPTVSVERMKPGQAVAVDSPFEKVPSS